MLAQQAQCHKDSKRICAIREIELTVANQSSSGYITGVPDRRCDHFGLDQLKPGPGTVFEVIQTGPIIHQQASRGQPGLGVGGIP
jgi:hypothetical protein